MLDPVNHQSDIQVESVAAVKDVIFGLGSKRLWMVHSQKSHKKVVWSKTILSRWGPTCGMAFLQELWKEFGACIVELSMFSAAQGMIQLKFAKGSVFPVTGEQALFVQSFDRDATTKAARYYDMCRERERCHNPQYSCCNCYPINDSDRFLAHAKKSIEQVSSWGLTDWKHVMCVFCLL